MIREPSKRKSYTYLPTITGLFTATLLISNVLNGKVLRVGPVPMTCGLILFPLAYLFGDVLTEVYGYSEARKVIWTDFASLILFVVMIEICGALPADPSWPLQEAYEVILGRVPRIVTASMLAYFFGEFSNSYVLAKSKVRTQGRLMSLRFVLSTVVGEGIDTVVFVLVAFTGVISVKSMLSVTISGWVLKVLWEMIALPITLPVVNAIKRREHVDHFDTNTDFNPLRF
jgi:uncharacterized integral membrane protein (TIGR00697 family)